ncbi:DUF6544 family protein [Ramlibacter sp.]|uniref:DUF6544 family protein n=1 Tax=Ramlibacter sp. TaxID=1917967 RepID=UPI0026200D60|nr:DUF6544 family protein [Ramlibacter sp.]
MSALAAALVLRGEQERHGREVDALKHQLETGRRTELTMARKLEGLPPPVRRYLQMVLPTGAPRPPRIVTLRQHGELRTDVTSAHWMPFEATHLASPGATGFVWDAWVNAAPFIHIRVLDSLIQGRGAGQVLLLSALDVGHDGATPEMNSGSLHRFLAEAPWYPWALLPSDELSWTPVDDHRALATLSAQGTTVALEFRFAESGEVQSIYTPGRWGSFGGAYAKLPWEGRFLDYQRQGGVLVPMRAEVGWYQGGKLALVWKASIDGVSTSY